MGVWKENGTNQQHNFEHLMSVGDIVAIKRGEDLIALVEVAGDYNYEEEPGELDWFERRRAVRVLDWYKPAYNFYVSPRNTLTKCNMDGDAATTASIWNWYTTYKKNKDMQDKIDLLRYKKQIILQGPPGTGKTYMAQKIAEEMIKHKTIGNPKQKIDVFFEQSRTSSAAILAKRDEIMGLLLEFQEKYPKEELKALSLEDYAFGKGKNDGFCYWLEYVLWEAGLYSGQAGKFKIFWKKEINGYSKIGFLKEVTDDNDAMRLLAEQLYSVANEIDPEGAAQKLSRGLVLKMLHSYYPDKYFPINNEVFINNALKLLGIDGSKLNFIEKNKALQAIFLEKKSKFGSEVTNFEFMHFLLDNFNIKGNITIQENTEVSGGAFKIIQFHPAYTYEDFVRGIVTDTDGGNSVAYTVKNKVLMEFAEEARNNPKSDFVLIIDEINRANLPAVLGELIYALEYRGRSVDCLYELDDDRSLTLPPNLYFIGTMNTADRSVGHIDYAIRRRFSFVDIPPAAIPELTDAGKALFNKVAALFCKGGDLNQPILTPSAYLSPEFKPTDVMPGHSYFLVKEEDRVQTGKEDNDILSLKLEFEIKPLLREYLKDGILLKDAEAVIEYLSV